MLAYPVMFVSSAYVRVSTLPSWMRPVADHQPITIGPLARARFASWLSMLSVKAELHSLWLAADYLANMDAGLGRCRRLHLRFARSRREAARRCRPRPLPLSRTGRTLVCSESGGSCFCSQPNGAVRPGFVLTPPKWRSRSPGRLVLSQKARVRTCRALARCSLLPSPSRRSQARRHGRSLRDERDHCAADRGVIAIDGNQSRPAGHRDYRFTSGGGAARAIAMPRRQSSGLGRQDDRNAREASARHGARAAPTRRGLQTSAIRWRRASGAGGVNRRSDRQHRSALTLPSVAKEWPAQAPAERCFVAVALVR